MAVETPTAALMAVGGTVCGIALGIFVGRQTASSPPPRAEAQHVVQEQALRPTPPPPAALPSPPSAPTPAPAVVAPVQSDAATALRLSQLSGPALSQALCAVEMQSNTGITFAALERSPGRFNTEVAVFRGKILEIQDLPGEQGAFLRLGLDSWGQRVIAVVTYVAPPDNVVRGQRVKVYGRMAETFTYTSQAGWNITIPRLNAVAVLRDSEAPRCTRR